jgi:hypothetical protein
MSMTTSAPHSLAARCILISNATAQDRKRDAIDDTRNADALRQLSACGVAQGFASEITESTHTESR